MNKSSCILIITYFVIMSFLFIGCSDPTSAQANSDNDVKVTINSQSQSVIKGQELDLEAETSSSDVIQEVTWNLSGHSNKEDTVIAQNFSNPYRATLKVASYEQASAVTVTVTTKINNKLKTFSKKINLISNTPTVSAVIISPKQADVVKGSEQQFTAKVEAANGASEDVLWSVMNNSDSETRISKNGLLYVGENENEANTLTVYAQSEFATSRIDTAAVKVTASLLPQLPKPATLSLSAEGAASWTYSNANLNGFRLQLYKDDAAHGASIPVSSSTNSYDFLSEMRKAPGVYKFTVTALVTPGNTNFSNSPRSDYSAERTIKALTNPQAPSWNASEARWPRVADASEYLVELFKEGNDTRIGAARRVAQVAAGTGSTVQNVSYNFSSDLSANKAGSYIFTVQAVATGKLLLDSETVTVTAPYVYITFRAGNAPFGSSSLSSVYDVAVNTAGNVFVAVGDNGRIGRSTNGTSWTNLDNKTNNPALDFSTPNDMRAVAYGNGRFVAVGNVGRIITSTDGEKWTRTEDIPKEYTEAAAASKYLHTVIWTGEYFIASGINSTYNKNNGTQVLRSLDGIKWERTFNDRTPTTGGGGNGKTIFGLANNGGNVLAVGARGTATYSSDHGKSGSWGRISDSILGMSASDKTERIDAFDAAYGNNTWVVVGGDGRIAYTNGQNVTFSSDWTLRHAESTRFNNSGAEGDDIRSVAFASGMFIAVSSRGRVSTSADGHNWYAIPRGTSSGQTRFAETERINAVKSFVQNGETKFILGGFNRSTGASKIVISE